MLKLPEAVMNVDNQEEEKETNNASEENDHLTGDFNSTGQATISLTREQIITAILSTLVAIEIILVLLDLFVGHHGAGVPNQIRRMFYLTREDSFGTWFSSTLTFMIAIVLWINFARAKFEKRAVIALIVWFFMAGFFTYTSADDGAKIHERIGSALKVAARDRAEELERAAERGDSKTIFDLFPSYPWQLVFAPVFGGMGLLIVYVIFVLMSDRYAQMMVFIGLGLLVLAVGMDFLEGMPKYSNSDFPDFLSASDENRNVRHYFKVLEEFIEMLGMSLILCGFTQHLLTEFPHWKLHFKSSANK